MQMRSRGDKATKQNKPHTIYRLLAVFNRARTLMPTPTHTKQTETHAHGKQQDMYKPTHFVLLALGPGTSLCCLVLCRAELFSCKHTRKRTRFHLLLFTTKPNSASADCLWWPSCAEALSAPGHGPEPASLSGTQHDREALGVTLLWPLLMRMLPC